jgi:hypothetical protein
MMRPIMKSVFTAVLAGGWLTGTVMPAASEVTKSQVRERARAGAVQTQDKWQSLTPEQQQQAKMRGQAAAQRGQAKWQSLTPEQQQQAREKGNAGAQKARTKWQSLPE